MRAEADDDATDRDESPCLTIMPVTSPGSPREPGGRRSRRPLTHDVGHDAIDTITPSINATLAAMMIRVIVNAICRSGPRSRCLQRPHLELSQIRSIFAEGGAPRASRGGVTAAHGVAILETWVQALSRRGYLTAGDGHRM